MSQDEILAEIHRNPGVSQKDIGVMFGHKGTISKQINSLKKKHLIRKVLDKRNRTYLLYPLEVEKDD